MKAIKPINPGAEIFNDYGEIPRADLLRRYGYVTDNYAPYDVVELPLEFFCEAAGLSDADAEEQPPVINSLKDPFPLQMTLTYRHSSNYLNTWSFSTTDMSFLGYRNTIPLIISFRMNLLCCLER